MSSKGFMLSVKGNTIVKNISDTIIKITYWHCHEEIATSEINQKRVSGVIRYDYEACTHRWTKQAVVIDRAKH